MDEFNVEQQVVIALMRQTGAADPEATVRADPIFASLLGSHLVPALERVLARIVEVAGELSTPGGQTERS